MLYIRGQRDEGCYLGNRQVFLCLTCFIFLDHLTSQNTQFCLSVLCLSVLCLSVCHKKADSFLRKYFSNTGISISPEEISLQDACSFHKKRKIQISNNTNNNEEEENGGDDDDDDDDNNNEEEENSGDDDDNNNEEDENGGGDDDNNNEEEEDNNGTKRRWRRLLVYYILGCYMGESTSISLLYYFHISK